MKKAFAFILIICLSIGSLLPAQNAQANTIFNDIPSGSVELQAAVQQLNEANIISGFTDGTFRPNNPITREQMAVIIARALQLDTTKATQSFPDVNSNSVYAPSIRTLAQLGIISGFPNGKYYPKQYVTRLQAVTILNRAFKLTYTDDEHFFKDVATTNEHVKALYFNGITMGMSDTSFGANVNVTRGQASIFIYRIMQLTNRGNVVYYKTSSLPISSIAVVEQSSSAVRLIPSENGLRVLPVSEGSGQFIVKGLASDTTIPLTKHLAYSYEVTKRNGKYFVSVEEQELENILEHHAQFYSFTALNLSFTPTTVAITNEFALPVKEELYYVGSNNSGLEIAIFEPGSYKIVLSNGTQSATFEATVTIKAFATTISLKRQR